jgi:RNase P/RNase MRP subunit p29
MSEPVDWNQVLALLDTLYSASDRLELLFPSRKFTLDGHLVGSIGEVIAAYMFDLNLLRGSNKGHDAISKDGRNIEVKLTQGKSVSIRHEPDHLIVLQRRRGARVSVIFNGPGALAWAQAGKMQNNGQRPISLVKLRQINEGIEFAARLAQIQEAPL